MSRTRRSPRTARPLERLEPRTLMAVFTVNSTADILSPPAGTVTLRSAIQAANTSPGPNTINLPLAGTYKITTLATATDNSAGELAIADDGDLAIQNTSGGTVTIDGGGLNRVFDVDPAGSVMPFTVTFAGLVITDGRASNDYGGGIAASGAANIILNGCVLDGNLSGLAGGGVAMRTGSTGTLTLNGSRVSMNRTAGSGGGGIAGLGTGAVTIGTGSVVTENAALGSSGGGGIWVSGAPLNVVGAVVSDNRTITIGLTTPVPGGGIENTGAGPVVIAGSIVEDNTAEGIGGGYADTGLASLTVRNSFILNNVAGKSGGGLAPSGPSITLTNATVAGNTALSGNLADGGGGVYVTGTGTTRVTDSTFAGNTAIAEGGGIFDSNAAKLIVTGSTLSGNRTLSGAGGGLDSSTTGDVAISNSIFRDNTSSSSGGGLMASTGTVEIAASRFTGNAGQFGGAAEFNNSVFSINGSTFDANRALVSSGALSAIQAIGDSVTNSTFVGNQADLQGAIGLFGNAGSTLAMIDDTVDGNTDTVGGSGGVYQTIGTLTIQGTIIAGNIASGVPADYNYVGGTLTDKGGNLLGTTAGSSSKFGPGTIVADPKLGPLLDHGGLTAGAPSDTEVIPTQALPPGSPAFGKGVATGAPATDERGFARHASPSIGAYEPSYSSVAPAIPVLVDDLYETLLNRPVDPNGLVGGVNFLNAGGSATALVQALESSGEFLAREATQIVRRYLDRAPSSSEVSTITGFLASGHTPEQAAAIFINSAEFSGDYGNNQDAFIEALYQATLGRAAAPAEVAAWDSTLAAGLSRPAMVNLFLTSGEYLADLIADDFQAYLGRPPRPSEAAACLAAMHSGFSDASLAALVLGTAESFADRT